MPGNRNKETTCWWASIRLAPLVVLLFLFQIFADASAQKTGGSVHASTSLDAGHCVGTDAPKTPAQHCDHSQCCVLRQANDDSDSPILAEHPTGFELAPRIAITDFAPPSDGGPAIKTRWKSAWSSRAPPIRALRIRTSPLRA